LHKAKRTVKKNDKKKEENSNSKINKQASCCLQHVASTSELVRFFLADYPGAVDGAFWL